MQNGSAVKLHSVTKLFTRNGEQIRAVDDLSLEIPRGKVFGLLGPNGAGKTTAIKMICTLISPSGGRIEVAGIDVARNPKSAVAHIGALLEGARNIYWALTPWQNLLYFGRLKGCGGAELKIRAEKLLRELELWDRRTAPVMQLSRGMQQKTAIACAIIADPEIILLDEPTLGLDTQATITMKAWINALSRQAGKTVILTSHQVDLIEELCDEVAIMRHGALLACEPVRNLLQVFSRDVYRIVAQGKAALPECYNHGRVEARHEDGETRFACSFPDQAELIQFLNALHKEGKTITSFAKDDPSLEEVFIRLIQQKKAPASSL